ncbi:MAG: ROK family protein [Armatimonadetes bacterium]|nr:ROK family protein [Armatimonadota bacterium]
MDNSRKGVKLLKQNSRAAITLCLRMNGPLSKAQLAKSTGLSLTCICDTCKELLAEGVLAEVGAVTGPRGRPMVLLTINPNGAAVAGVRLTPEAIEIVVATPTLDILARRIINWDSTSDDVEATIDTIVTGIERCADAADRNVRTLGGVGVVVHGVRVNPVLGVIEETTYMPGWQDVPITRLLEEQLQIPVVADNCVRAGALTHHWFSSERREGGTFYLVVAEGVGGALLYGQEPVHGIHHSGNMIGHTIIDASGPQCSCGNHGCLEALSSDIAFIRGLWPEVAKQATSMPHAEREALVRRGFEMARKGDPKAKQSYANVVKYLGIGIANSIALFAPRTIIVAGTLIDLSPSTVIDDIRLQALNYIKNRDRGVEIRAAVNCKEFLSRGAVGLILCQPYRAVYEDNLKARAVK